VTARPTLGEHAKAAEPILAARPELLRELLARLAEIERAARREGRW
jgi:hypothetical protein